jgi:hypothetical protein
MTSSVVDAVARSRALQDEFDTRSLYSPTGATSSNASYGPTETPVETRPPTPAGSKDAATGFGWFTLSMVILVVLIVLWRLWVRYKRKAEQRMLDYRSAQADRVLGDMQMVPNEDLDNDLL